MSLTTECMLMNLQIGVWMGYKLDKQASDELTTMKGAADDAARVNKHLVPKEALNPIIAAGGAVRRHFYTNTLPWKDNGDRILTRKRYEKFIQQHSELVGEFNAAVAHFLKKSYPAARDRAEFRMGEMFKDTDYPTPNFLKSKFYVSIDIEPVAEGKDFRVDIGKAAVASVRSQMDEAIEARIKTANADLWKRLKAVTSYFQERMADGGKFKATTVTNLQELVTMLPELNFTDDPDLNAVHKRISEQLAIYEPQDLRDDEKLRTNAAREASKILKDMGGFMKALGA